MKKIILLFMVLALFIAGCSNTSQVNSNAVLDKEHVVNIDKLEIYHFHGTHQCYSCKTVGAYAEETINTYFADELKSGKIVFGHVNVDLAENKELAARYGAAGSSLWLGTYDKTGFRKEENTNVWYKISDKEDYISYLKGIIEKRLSGDLS